MSTKLCRAAAALFLAASAAVSLAETYTAVIYSVPIGYDYMVAAGLGDTGQMSGYGLKTGLTEQALYMTPTGVKSMHPAGFLGSRIADTDGSIYHAGFGAIVPPDTRALFWVGGGAATDLHPGAPWIGSAAWGVRGYVQSGSAADAGGIKHACTWGGTAASFKVLVTPSHSDSVAYGTDGSMHTGSGKTGGLLHALLWPGWIAAAIDLNPAGYQVSEALSIHSGQQGGYVIGIPTAGKPHAALWTGTPGSFVDLNPTPFVESAVARVRGGVQVGAGKPTSTPTRKQAIAWHGTAGSWINLHFKLPYPFTFWNSAATDIDASGNIVGTIESPDGSIKRAVIWLRS